MVILYPNSFDHSPSAGFDGLFNWDFLKAAWDGTSIEPMDFDAVIERYGRFLGFETKDEGIPIPLGQRIAIEAAVRAGWTFIVCSKRPEEIDGWQIWWRSNDGVSIEKCRGDAEDLIRRVRKWFEKASLRRIPQVRYRPFVGQGDLLGGQMTRLEMARDSYLALTDEERAVFADWMDAHDP